MSKIYGIWAGHDSSVVYIEDGKIINILDEQKESGIKSPDPSVWYPTISATRISELTGVPYEHADHIIVPRHMGRDYVENKMGISNYEQIPHHLAHCAGAYYASGLQGKVLAVSLDGTGEYSRGNVYLCEDNKMKLVHRLRSSLSSAPAGPYGQMTEFFFGWKALKDEGKLVGLSGHGTFREEFYRYFKQTLWYDSPSMTFQPVWCEYQGLNFMIKRMIQSGMNIIEQDKLDMAATFQTLIEEVTLDYLTDLRNKYPEYTKCAFSGGLFANVKLNMRINDSGLFEEIVIHPGMGDVGQSLGAALWKAATLGEWKVQRLNDVFFGESFTQQQIKEYLKLYNFKSKPFNESGQTWIIDQITKQKIIGWFKGSYEYGPRALGARSIICDPTNSDMPKILNKRLGRNDIMPFAPIVMEEHADTVFQISGSSYTAEFMTICYDTSPYWKDKIPAVVHEVDKTARPQIVNKDRNFHFWNILNRYHKRTGIPVLLNTSFNIHGESIINSPDKAMKHLDNGVVDVLVLEDVIYTKK